MFVMFWTLMMDGSWDCSLKSLTKDCYFWGWFILCCVIWRSSLLTNFLSWIEHCKLTGILSGVSPWSYSLFLLSSAWLMMFLRNYLRRCLSLSLWAFSDSILIWFVGSMGREGYFVLAFWDCRSSIVECIFCLICYRFFFPTFGSCWLKEVEYLSGFFSKWYFYLILGKS